MVDVTLDESLLGVTNKPVLIKKR